MKKRLSIILSIVLIISLFPMSVLADVTSDITSEDEIEEIKELHNEIYGDTLEVNEDIGKEYNLYKKKLTRESQFYSIMSDEYSDDFEDPNFKESYDTSLEEKYLDNFTEEKYEVALAKSDGSYLFFSANDSYEESVEVTEKVEENINTSKTMSSNEYIPCIIDDEGIVVYATNGMGRALKYTNGVVNNSEVTYLHDSTSTVGTTNTNYYINHNYIEDVPIIDITETALKVMVNGYIGWGKRDPQNKTYDFTIVPMNQVYNPSYYKVVNNQICHYISNDITDQSKSKGNTISVGVAPEYLKTGINYYSYDGHYFYTDLTTLTSDLRNNTTVNAINPNNPYYNYYQFLPYRSKTSYTAAQLDQFINANTKENSKLRGLGSTLISAQDQYGVNAAIILGVAINESGWGLSSIAQNKNNIFGLNAVDSNPGEAANTYSSASDCVNQFAKYYISKQYANPQDWKCYGGFLGNKKVGSNVKYASDPYWGEKNASHFFNIDKVISGYNNNGYNESKLLDYNKYIIGLINSDVDVNFSNGSKIYSASSKFTTGTDVVGGTTILTSSNIKAINNINCYEVVPAITKSTGFDGNFSWNTYGYIDKSKITILNKSKVNVNYQTHVQDYGWQNWVSNGEMSGTSGQSKRLEGIKIKLDSADVAGGITYRTHVQNIGWQNWVSNGEMSGTSGQALRLEAIQINLTGEMANNYDIYYRVHAQNYGWLGWTKNGQSAGTEGLSKRLEGIEIVLVTKGGSAPGSTNNAFIEAPTSVQYQTHVQEYGWQSWVSDGSMSGTSGQSKRLEAIQIKLENKKYTGSISYRTHVQDYGWQNWVSDGAMSGTSGQSKRLEAIEIKLTGEMANNYDIYYRVHAQDYGWLGWAKNGQSAGTEGLSKRLEGIEIVLVTKGGSAPGPTNNAFIKK